MSKSRKSTRRRPQQAKTTIPQWALPAAIVAVLVLVGVVWLLTRTQNPASQPSAVADGSWTEPTQSACLNAKAPDTAPVSGGTKQWSAPQNVIDLTHTYCAFVTTNKGQIVIELYPQVAPKNVNNFVFLAQQNFYDNLTWHRVIPGFVAQTGDPKGDGSGGPGYNVPLEVTPKIKYDREGRVGVARSQADDSAGSQFFITLAPQPSLDPHSKELPDNDGYTIIGQVVKGMDTVRAITPFQADQSPGGKGDPLVSIRVVDLTKSAQ